MTKSGSAAISSPPGLHQARTARRRPRSGLVVGYHEAGGTGEMDLRSVMLMPSLVCLLGAVDAINRASLQFRETGEGVVGIREQEAVGGRVADNGDVPLRMRPSIQSRETCSRLASSAMVNQPGMWRGWVGLSFRSTRWCCRI